MGAGFRSFSIREYVSKVRSVDEKKCWPFSGDLKGVLPPIACRKFKWWLSDIPLPEELSPSPRPKTTAPKPLNSSKISSDSPKPETAIKSNVVSETGSLEARCTDPSWKEGVRLTNLMEVEPEAREAEKVALEKTKAVLDKENSLNVVSENSTVKICPVCRNFSSATINAVNAHIDRCLAKGEGSFVKGKQKVRVTKKRSIMEIFAEAPQVATGANSENSDGFVGFSNSKREEREKCEKKKKKRNKMREEAMEMRRKWRGLGISALSEKLHALKMPPSMHIPGSNQDALYRKKSGGVAGPNIKTRKLSKLKKLAKHDGLKHKKEAVPKHPQSKSQVYPLSGNLKNRTVSSSVPKSSAKSCLKRGPLKQKISCDRRSGKHVRFLGKDDILGYKKKQCLPIESAQEQNLCKLFSEVVGGPTSGQPSCSDAKCPSENAPLHDGNREEIEHVGEVASINTGEDGENNLSDKNWAPNNQFPVSTDAGKTGSSEPVDLNLAVQQLDSSLLFNPVSSNTIDTETDAENPSGNSTHITKKFPGSVGNPVARSLPLSSQPIRPRISNLLPCTVETDLRKCSEVASLYHRSIFPLSSRDLMANMDLSQFKKQSFCNNGNCGTSRTGSFSHLPSNFPRHSSNDPCVNEGFIGLPLNSQGELIRPNVNGQSSFNQFFPDQTMVIDYAKGVPFYRPTPHVEGAMDNAILREEVHDSAFLWFENHNCLRKASFNRPSSLHDIRRPESQCIDTMGKNQLCCHSEPAQASLNIFSQPQIHQGLENRDQIFDYSLQPTKQPTMRLMGKDVAIGRSNEVGIGFGDPMIWTDKLLELDPRTAASAKEWLFLENGSTSVEPQRNITPPTFLPVKPLDPQFASSLLDCNSQPVTLNTRSLIDGVKSNYLPHSFPPETSAPHILQYPDGHILEKETNKMSHSRPSKQACGQQIGHNKYHPSDIDISGSRFHFLNKDSQNRTQPTWTPSHPAPTMPEWLMKATKQNPAFISSTSQPCSIPIFGYRTFPAPYFAYSDTNFPTHKPNVSHSSLHYPLAQNSQFNPLQFQGCSGFKSTSETNATSIKIKETTNNAISNFKDFDQTKKSKKRPLENDIERSKHMKKQTIQVQEEGAKPLTGSKNSCKHRMLERFSTGENEKALRIGGQMNCFQPSRTGPVKLSAGAKHILKPRQSAYHDHSRPTHCTIPFVVEAGPRRDLETQNKTAKIYRL
ncbi:uncharacterized protein LOC18442408 [Amborella trichopoda]|nr:uncharacterized protein LOC18442408 [Amborella trichopoda]|eukprot:XP_020527992.1 uncharacterized protein LOC18442408 [Amborella trichopoda]